MQPFLVVGGGKGHQVFTDIGLAVAQCRTVLHVFPCIVDAEIQVYLSCRRIGAQVENVTAHVSLGNNVFIAHVRIGKANSGFSAVHTYDGGVGGGDTRAEEVGRIVGDNEERRSTPSKYFNMFEPSAFGPQLLFVLDMAS